MSLTTQLSQHNSHESHNWLTTELWVTTHHMRWLVSHMRVARHELRVTWEWSHNWVASHTELWHQSCETHVTWVVSQLIVSQLTTEVRVNWVVSQLTTELWVTTHHKRPLASHMRVSRHELWVTWELCIYLYVYLYGVATLSRLLKMVGLFCKRAL